jgi:hypothetical protein
MKDILNTRAFKVLSLAVAVELIGFAVYITLNLFNMDGIAAVVLLIMIGNLPVIIISVVLTGFNIIEILTGMDDKHMNGGDNGRNDSGRNDSGSGNNDRNGNNINTTTLNFNQHINIGSGSDYMHRKSPIMPEVVIPSTRLYGNPTPRRDNSMYKQVRAGNLPVVISRLPVRSI